MVSRVRRKNGNYAWVCESGHRHQHKSYAQDCDVDSYAKAKMEGFGVRKYDLDHKLRTICVLTNRSLVKQGIDVHAVIFFPRGNDVHSIEVSGYSIELQKRFQAGASLVDEFIDDQEPQRIVERLVFQIVGMWKEGPGNG